MTKAKIEPWWVAQLRWWFLGIGVGLTSVLLTSGWRWLTGEADLWSPALDHGQLLFGSVGIAAGSIARLLRPAVFTDLAIVVISASFLQAVIGAALFAAIFAVPSVTPALRVIDLSVISWTAAVLVGSASVGNGAPG